MRTGARAAVLADLLEQGGLRQSAAPEVPQLSALPAELVTDVLGVYRALGGVLDSPKLRPGAWDLAFDDDLVVELDEELHFNRYRLLTLDAPWYSDQAWAPEYRELCVDHEEECLSAGKWGQRWTNDSCIAMFGPGSPRGVLDGAGAPRWKQRALYDAMKDLMPLVNGLNVARVSTYDLVEDVPLGAALEHRATLDMAALAKLVQQRSA